MAFAFVDICRRRASNRSAAPENVNASSSPSSPNVTASTVPSPDRWPIAAKGRAPAPAANGDRADE
jgi:hypothetical protein